MEQTLPLMLRARARETPDLIAQYVKDKTGNSGQVFKPKYYRQFYDEIRFAAGGLLELGCGRGDHIGIISDNRPEWMLTDFGILSIGAADVPRGSDATAQEIGYILGVTECALAFAENTKQVLKLLSRKQELPCLKTLITYDPVEESVEKAAGEAGVEILYFASLIALGQKHEALKPGDVEREMEKGNRDDLATIIFTSGTTGEPKGVMLSHGNFLHQLPAFEVVLEVKPGDIWLSVLPVWHVYERTIEYIIFYFKSGIAYSKPIATVLLEDFRTIRPQWMVGVPRIWEAIMDGIYRNVKQMGGLQKQFFDFFVSFGLMYTYFKDLTFGLLPNFHGRIRALDAVMGFFPWLLLSPVRGLAALLVFNRIKEIFGGRFRAGVSGGGSLPGRVDHFFNAVGIRLQEGYGLTETAPLVSVRRYKKSRRGTIGQVLLNTEVVVLDDKGRALPPGHNGLIYVRGGQVMKGYYQNPEATAAVLSPDGWINTGDIGMMTRDNELRITGRAKDTIVLRGGENVEPVPIECKMRESEYIFQCMVVGQDQKYLAALIVPVQSAIMSFAEENNIPSVDYELLLQQPEINQIIANDVAGLVSSGTGFKPFERVFKFRLIPTPFEPGKELSGKEELLRHRIAAHYAREIHSLFKPGG
ncbi:MAG: long-chain fatty acid--CoA ligase [Treponema sp.]|jgi:long-chain acyl-CoA synthetase|nr:long-chain fatty acid--CoA ligase [Treponema sp.]